MEVVINKKYRHFKGEEVVVLGIGKNTETLEDMVIYMALSTGIVWVRPYEMFTSLVDKEKYPEVLQTYRFEEV